ncbi:SDR family NAD(P)-dependent oxidoreductase [Amycolatopsis sp. lyj-23]|uniref:SDR family NAD(P)-dependent oxidoreductase n=1 Tax=Amycolatopsis sp. lyj-23 TaxID=2789283 RepID=UPI00397AEEF2
MFTTVVDTAVHGTLHLARAVLPVLRAQHAGTFIGVNSLLGSVTVLQIGAYAALKWASELCCARCSRRPGTSGRCRSALRAPAVINTHMYYQAANYTGHAVRPRGRCWPRNGWPRRLRGWPTVPAGTCPSRSVRATRSSSRGSGSCTALRPAGRPAGPAGRAHPCAVAATPGTHAPADPARDRIRGHWPVPPGEQVIAMPAQPLTDIPAASS